MAKYKLVVNQGKNWDNYLMCPKTDDTKKGESIDTRINYLTELAIPDPA